MRIGESPVSPTYPVESQEQSVHKSLSGSNPSSQPNSSLSNLPKRLANNSNFDAFESSKTVLSEGLVKVRTLPDHLMRKELVEEQEGLPREVNAISLIPLSSGMVDYTFEAYSGMGSKVFEGGRHDDKDPGQEPEANGQLPEKSVTDSDEYLMALAGEFTEVFRRAR